MKRFFLILICAGLALSSLTLAAVANESRPAAAPAPVAASARTVLIHRSAQGELLGRTTVTSNADGSRITGYAGDEATTEPHAEAVARLRAEADRRGEKTSIETSAAGKP